MVRNSKRRSSARMRWSILGVTRTLLLDMQKTNIMALTPRDRFFNLLTFLHLADNTTALPRDDPNHDKLHKVRPIYDVLYSRFASVYSPSCELSLDEGMVPWKGRLSFKQYLPKKPVRFGVKLYMVMRVQADIAALSMCTLVQALTPTLKHQR